MAGANFKLVQRIALQELDRVQAAKGLHNADRQQAGVAVAEPQAGADQQEPCEEGTSAGSANAPGLQAAKPESLLGGSAGETVGRHDYQRDPDQQFSAQPEREVQHAEPQAHQQQEVWSIMQ